MGGGKRSFSFQKIIYISQLGHVAHNIQHCRTIPESNKLKEVPEAMMGIQPNESGRILSTSWKGDLRQGDDSGAKSQKMSQGTAELTLDPLRLKVQLEGTAQKPVLGCISLASNLGNPEAVIVRMRTLPRSSLTQTISIGKTRSKDRTASKILWDWRCGLRGLLKSQ